MLRDHYFFHKKSIKALKDKKYKAWRGQNDIVPEYVLPEGCHIDFYKKTLKKIQEIKKQHENKFTKDDEKMPSFENQSKQENSEN